MERTRVKGVRETFLRKTFWPNRKEITGGWKNCIKVSFMFCWIGGLDSSDSGQGQLVGCSEDCKDSS
jgi:hypothetical protein